MKEKEIMKALEMAFTPEQRIDILKALSFSLQNYEKRGNEEKAREMKNLCLHVAHLFDGLDDTEETGKEQPEQPEQIAIINPEEFAKTLNKIIKKSINKAFRKVFKEYEKEREEQFRIAVIRIVPCVMGFDPAENDDTEPEKKKDGKRDIPVE